MNLLLDTHVFLWWLQDSRRLSRVACRVIGAQTSSVFVSAVSVWEIAIKISIGKLKWQVQRGVALEESVAACGFTELPVTARHAAGVRDLAVLHNDPFDRLLVSQALAESLRLVTGDAVFAAYGVPVIAAED